MKLFLDGTRKTVKIRNRYASDTLRIYKRYAIAVSRHENQNLQQDRDSPMSMA